MTTSPLSGCTLLDAPACPSCGEPAEGWSCDQAVAYATYLGTYLCVGDEKPPRADDVVAMTRVPSMDRWTLKPCGHVLYQPVEWTFRAPDGGTVKVRVP